MHPLIAFVIVVLVIGLIAGVATAFSLEFAGRPDRSR